MNIFKRVFSKLKNGKSKHCFYMNIFKRVFSKLSNDN